MTMYKDLYSSMENAKDLCSCSHVASVGPSTNASGTFCKVLFCGGFEQPTSDAKPECGDKQLWTSTILPGRWWGEIGTLKGYNQQLQIRPCQICSQGSIAKVLVFRRARQSNALKMSPCHCLCRLTEDGTAGTLASLHWLLEPSGVWTGLS